MYEGLMETLKNLLTDGNLRNKPLDGHDNVLMNGEIKLVSGGNITFEGRYFNAEILEKKMSLASATEA